MTDAATPATVGAAAPAGVFTTVECVGNVAGAGDNFYAGFSQLWTGKETPTYADQAKEYLLDKAKEGGLWIKQKASDELEREIHEALTADERRFRAQYPEATHQDWVQLQNAEDSLDDGSAFQ